MATYTICATIKDDLPLEEAIERLESLALGQKEPSAEKIISMRPVFQYEDEDIKDIPDELKRYYGFVIEARSPEDAQEYVSRTFGEVLSSCFRKENWKK